VTRAGWALALAVLAGAPWGPAAAQVVDTLRPDTLARDTTDHTAQFLKSQAEARQLIPIFPRIGSTSLYPRGSRIILGPDSVLWHGAETVADLLTRVPGVYLLRGGWVGRPELPAYQAHGAASVSWLLDGMPYFSFGADSLAVDPSLLPLSLVDRVEIERLPGLLRVWLFTRRNDRNAPYSRIGIASGDLQIERYQGQLEKRSGKGPGFAVSFDHLGVPAQEGATGSYKNTQGLLRLDFVPSPAAGAEVQLFLASPEREAVLSGVDTLSRARHGTRRDLIGRAFYAPGTNGLGPRLDLLVSRSWWTDRILQDSTAVVSDVLDDDGNVIGQDTTWEHDDFRQGLTQVGLHAGYRRPRASLEAAAFWRSAWTPFELRLGVAIVPAPLPGLSIRMDGALLRHSEGRTSRWVTARAGLALPLGLSAAASWRLGDEQRHPMLASEGPDRVDDRSVSLAWDSRAVSLEAAFSTNAAFRPAGYGQYPAVGAIGPSPRTDWVTVSGRLAPRQWLILSGWFSNPLIAPEGQPPEHLLASALIQSKFLPTFRSGIFNLKLQFTVERWGQGILGQDSSGTQTILPAATFYRGFIGLQLGSFTAYYDRFNMQNSTRAYVPGLPLPAFASTFGVRWEFAN
jgi:hypothetical protein